MSEGDSGPPSPSRRRFVAAAAGVLAVGMTGAAKVDATLAEAPDLPAALRDRPADAACILASHNPDLLPEVPVSVSLTLSGHTHGGQVVLPFIGPPFTSSRYGRRFASGWVRGPALGYVSRGLGFGLVPIRVNCPAELTILELAPVT